ncbi:DNA-directed RNA polymerase subunit omega [Oenococcus kitaharae]|uniref:DNA-directed RNA polymerase subunit omega n=1 Tax=Oenococcus kitaharae DSM 17330 TaxID=1045004 RepID=G9WFL1_9LACO|nr:DNA-directed RNA polymerase subunit omega [Oenococcus kitaharae]EHN59303.1 DNA-directed RNA polymerase omega subunit [Oenococcus kitaharae DSM 17330]MCV3296047.1 DNA-directed RNA polymerase subunit omega [Oenococcus kitaharae]OEY82176.1 DNA-directed RNA polymerase subunit omega [Oenococcus kitaharae]OEY82599.1 DNA-directed RNA polymerase subunit omega [Oenococcus kitaharae]OEY84855.1 DNA-directed RNA polymerase subunit omega [Oenococcus kitaharae]
MSLMYPSVDELLEKVDSRYKLIALASKRAKELEELPRLKEELLKLKREEKPTDRDKKMMQDISAKLDTMVGPTLDSYKSVKPIGRALEEINQGNVRIDPVNKDESGD